MPRGRYSRCGLPSETVSSEDLLRSRSSRFLRPRSSLTRGVEKTSRLTCAGPRVIGSRGRIRAPRCARPRSSTQPSSGRDEALAAARAVVGREDEPRGRLPGRRRELVIGPHRPAGDRPRRTRRTGYRPPPRSSPTDWSAATRRRSRLRTRPVESCGSARRRSPAPRRGRSGIARDHAATRASRPAGGRATETRRPMPARSGPTRRSGRA